MPEQTLTTSQQEIKDLQKGYAVMEVKIDHITQSLSEIRQNHLVHINDQLTVMSKTLIDNNITLTALVNNKMTEMYASISSLRITDAKQEPSNNILTKVIEYAILAIVAGGIAYVVKGN